MAKGIGIRIPSMKKILTIAIIVAGVLWVTNKVPAIKKLLGE